VPAADAGPAERSMTVTWHDPVPSLGRLARMSGLDYLRAVGDGEIPPPPVARLLGMTWESVAEGEVVFGLEPHESHFNPIGAVHGGVLCTVLDSATGCAVHSTLPVGWGYTSIDFAVQYQRGVGMESGPLRIVGRVTKPGRRVAFAEAVATDASGRVVATATSSLLVFETRAG
jgi:uncharacterized protein (TIGR00369 family)